jgi:hypothetical protein
MTDGTPLASHPTPILRKVDKEQKDHAVLEKEVREITETKKSREKKRKPVYYVRQSSV